MEAGNTYLWSSRYGCVERAIQNFQKARSLVDMQQKTQQLAELANQRNSNSLSIQLNLLHLQGQAIVNIGIALVDTSERKITTPKVKIFQAIEEFKVVQILMVKLRIFAGKSKSSTEAISYFLKSKQLESLACRWMGMGLWLVSQETKSVESFVQASQFLNEKELKNWHKDFDDDILDLAAESIYATCDLVDRCKSKMEILDQSSRTIGNQMLGILNRALDRHTEISGTIERLYSTDRAKDFNLEYEITSAKDVIEHRDTIIKWWEENNKHPRDDGGNRRCLPSFKRSDLPSNTNVTLASEPTNSIFSSDGKKKRHHKQMTSNNTHGEHSGHKKKRDAVYVLSDTLINESLHQPLVPIKYRKWGDELAHAQNFGDENIEASSVRLQYPSVCPPMPLEYQ